MKQTTDLDKIYILIFKVNETMIGIDTEQISIMLKYEEAKDRELQIFSFGENLPFRDKYVNLRSPRVLVLKDENIATGLIVEQPEDIIHITVDSIQPLPSLIETCYKSGLFWGGVVVNREIVMLVNLYKLIEIDDSVL